MFIQPIVKVRLRGGSCVLVYRLTVMEKNEERNSSYTILAWSQWIGVSVDFCDCDISFLRN